MNLSTLFREQNKWRENSNHNIFLDFDNNATKDATDRQYNGTLLHNIKYGVRNGIKNGVELILDAEVFDYGYFLRHSSGFMVALSDNLDKAIINQRGFYVRPGTVNLVSLKGEGIITTEDAIRRFDPDLRQCYRDDEFNFFYLNDESGYRYSIDNCLYEAVILKVIKECKCTPFFAKLPNVDLQRCVGYYLACARYFLENINNDKLNMTHAVDVDGKEKKCYQRCNLQSEHISVTSANYPSKNTFENRDEMCIVVQKLRRICDNPAKFKIFEQYYSGKDFYPKKESFCVLVKKQMADNICLTSNAVNPNKGTFINNVVSFGKNVAKSS